MVPRRDGSVVLRARPVANQLVVVVMVLAFGFFAFLGSERTTVRCARSEGGCTIANTHVFGTMAQTRRFDTGQLKGAKVVRSDKSYGVALVTAGGGSEDVTTVKDGKRAEKQALAEGIDGFVRRGAPDPFEGATGSFAPLVVWAVVVAVTLVLTLNGRRRILLQPAFNRLVAESRRWTRRPQEIVLSMIERADVKRLEALRVHRIVVTMTDGTEVPLAIDGPLKVQMDLVDRLGDALDVVRPRTGAPRRHGNVRIL